MGVNTWLHQRRFRVSALSEPSMPELRDHLPKRPHLRLARHLARVRASPVLPVREALVRKAQLEALEPLALAPLERHVMPLVVEALDRLEEVLERGVLGHEERSCAG
ncbi:MAG: hypothetical protein Q4C09_10190 [Atopobiaceae bacterium]|nr:hypothetical protein [Atopobiaceae bacterium]